MGLTIIFSIYTQNQELESVFKKIDAALEQHSERDVSEILKNYKNKQIYSQIEKYLLDSVHNLVIDEEYEFARDISFIVIDNNLENFEAIDLYSFIQKSIENDKKYKESK